MTAATGKLVVISGPSGAGKSTLVERLMATLGDRVRLSISATTRPPRPGEQADRDYHFLAPEEFARRRQAGEFLECAEVYPGLWYGTLRSEVTPFLEAGKSVVLEIDVQGAQSVLQQYPQAVTIFVRPASLEELERRLRGRGTESAVDVQRRLETARRELDAADMYRYQVVNQTGQLEAAVAQLRGILAAEGIAEDTSE